MRREQSAESAGQEWLHDEERRDGGVHRQRDLLAVRLELSQRRRERQWIVRERGALIVGAVLARTADGELDEHRRERQQDDPEDHPDHPERARVAIVAIAAAEPHRPLRHLRHVADRAGDRCDDGHHERVSVANVPELVRQHAGEFPFGHDVEDPARHRDDRVLRVAAGGERVRRGLIDDEDAWRRETRGLGDAADDPVELRRLGSGDRLRARERERDAVAEPPGAEVQDERDEQRGQHRTGTEEHACGGDEDQREEREEPDDLDGVHASIIARPIHAHCSGPRITDARPPVTSTSVPAPVAVARNSTTRSTPLRSATRPSARGNDVPDRIARPSTIDHTPASPNVAKPRGSVAETSTVARPCASETDENTPCAAESSAQPTPTTRSQRPAAPSTLSPTAITANVARIPEMPMKPFASAEAVVFVGSGRTRPRKTAA